MMDLVPGSAIPPRNTRRVDEGLFRIKVDYLGYDGFVRRVDIAQCRFSTAVGELLGREELVGIGKDLDLYVAVARPSRVGFAYASDECTLDALEIDSIGYRLYAVARVDVKC
ncbi:hypothetical protein LPJ56_002869 [Coemansia sp. RSA 2599]|nr:hypothetical protein LPJ75_005667 [Coemansia sp. RSA 2598]KAJ1824173.1 hypothetical protein LPJ56_002869 [Coemansia sp. RSA 2599]